MSSAQPLSPTAEDVRRLDRDRFVTALFAPPEARERLLALYAFNLELARVRDSVREPMAGMIRLQWWRDVLAGERAAEAARHPVAAPLVAVARPDSALREELDRLLTAREADLAAETFPDLPALENYARETAGALGAAAVRLLDGGESDVAVGRAIGTAFGLIGLLRLVPHHLSTGWLTLPLACLRQAGTTAEEVLSGAAPRRTIAEATRAVAQRAHCILAEARRHRVERRVLPALLPASLASGHYATLKRAKWDVFDARVARPRPMPVRLAANALLGRF